MKAPLKARRPTAEEAVRIAIEAAPELPPARLTVEDKQQPFSTRFRASTISALEGEAKRQGTTMNQGAGGGWRKRGAGGLGGWNAAEADLERGDAGVHLNNL